MAAGGSCEPQIAATAAFDAVALLIFPGDHRPRSAVHAMGQSPQSLARSVVARLFAMRYRLQVQGLEHLPSKGGLLLLGNHVSWIDWAMLQIASPRPIRFVLDRQIYGRWYVRPLADAFGAIPIGHGSNAEALQAVTENLNRGEAVCLFPEGQLTRNGQLGQFRHGFERAAAEAEAEGVILPFYIHGLWGSRFSRAGRGMRERRRAPRVRDVIVGFGESLPMSADATHVKQAVTELSVRCWQQHVRTLPTLPAAWLRTAKRHGRAPAVADSSGDWLSRRRLVAAVLAFARHLQRHAQGERVGILLPPTRAGMIANLAALLCGRTVVNLNYSSEPATVRAALERAGIRDVITAGRFVTRLQARGIDVDALLGDTRRHDMEAFRAAIGRGGQLFALAATCLPTGVLERAFGRRPDPDDTAAILFSSGSEGTPKGVELSHRNILGNARQVADVIDAEPDDVLLGNLPLFHAFGLTVTSLLPAVEGVPVVCHPDPTDAVGSARAVARHRATIMCSTSTFLRLFARNSHIHPLMLEPLRLVVAGAERLDPTVRETFERRFTKRVYEGFGATETSPVASCNLPDRLDTSTWKIQTGEKPATVGMPLPGTAIRVVDPDTNETLPTDADGMILIGGVQIMKGYLDDPERTAEAVLERDGLRWYRTGDRGHVDADGFLTIVDRYSRFAKIGGEMISLTRVEDAVRDAIPDASTELVAVNLPDERKGERIVLLVDERADANEIAASIENSDMHPLMVPAATAGVPAIPKLGSGKLDIAAARRLAAERDRG